MTILFSLSPSNAIETGECHSRSGRSQMFFKIGVLKKSQISQKTPVL